MATAISTAFQSTTAEDEHSLKPSRRAPPVPSVAYATTTAARAPELGERPIHQGNTEQIRAQQPLRQKQQQQYQPQSQPQTAPQQYSAQAPEYNQPQAYASQQQPQHFSRPSTQQTSYSQAQPTRGRQQAGAPEVIPPKKRSNSFSFLRPRRSTSNQPTTRIAQAQQQAASTAAAPPPQPRTSGASHHAQPSDGSVTSGSTGLFRARSKDSRSERNMLRKQSKLKQQQQLAELERQQRAHEAATRPPPRLPSHNPLPNIETFSADPVPHHAYTDPQSPPAVPNAANYPRAGMASPNGAPVRSSNPSVANGEYYEPSGERATSMTNRGRYSYASSTAQTGNVNSPRRVRRRKDPIAFNVLVIGARNSGKTSFISFLRNSLALRADRQESSAIQQPVKATFTSQYLETEIDGERVGVTLWDSAGLEKNVVDLQLREMAAFIESKFEDTFGEEQKVVRSPGFRDTHIHCVFLVLDPVRLDSNVQAATASGRNADCFDEDLDLQVLKALWGKTTVIPVISKADTLTVNHMTFLKRAVWQSIKNAKLSPLDALELDDDDDEEDEDGENDDYDEVKPKRPSHARQSSLSSTISDEDPYIPMSILSPDPYSMPPYTKYAPKSQSEIGRRYAWGFASPFDPQHCDFIRLRDTIFSEWRADLRELSRVKWYEQWRTSRLRHAPPKSRKGPSMSQNMPIRDMDSRQDTRNFSSGARSAPRTAQIDTQQGVSAPVGMAITTPGGMEQPSY